MIVLDNKNLFSLVVDSTSLSYTRRINNKLYTYSKNIEACEAMELISNLSNLCNEAFILLCNLDKEHKANILEEEEERQSELRYSGALLY